MVSKRTRLLDHIEQQLKLLIEDKLVGLFSSDADRPLVDMFLSILATNAIELENGKVIVPDLFLLIVPQGELEQWMEKRTLLDEIANEIYSHSIEANLQMNAYPKIIIESSTDLRQKHPIIQASISQTSDPLVDTTAFEVPESNDSHDLLPPNAIIIINGATSFSLQKPVINIGRRTTADLAIDDIQVSREHLQLRARNGRYILFDLGSLGGTTINNQHCQSATLVSGDVIQIGNTNLIYNDDARNHTTTNPMLDPSNKDK